MAINGGICFLSSIYMFKHLADAFIQSDLQCIQAIHFLTVCVFPGIEPTTFCAAKAMLYHWATGIPDGVVTGFTGRR